MTRVLLDVVTGIDDALALLYAVASPDLDLCGVSTVVGNVPVEVAARNSAAVLAHVGADEVPVALGAARTSTGGGPRIGPSNHRPDGLGGVSLTRATSLPPASVTRLHDDAAAAGPFTLVGLAPMTNLADLAVPPVELVLVGGELVVDEPPEFNAAHDLVATARVLGSGYATTLYVMDVFARVSVRSEHVELLRSSDRPGARLAGELLSVRREHLIGDAGALVLLTHPHLFRREPRQVGMSGDHLTETAGGRMLDIVVEVDGDAAARAFVDVLLQD